MPLRHTSRECACYSDVLRANGVIVVADEIYGRLTYNDTFTSMAKVANVLHDV